MFKRRIPSPGRRRALILFSALLTLPVLAKTLRSDEENPSALRYETLSGTEVFPLVSPNKKPVVLIFITTDCPIANGFAPEINRIYEEYSQKGIQMTLVHVDPDLTKQAATKHAKDYGLKPEIVLDPKHLLVAKVKATITPEAAVYDSSGKQIYLGRINDRYSGLGDRRNTVSEHNLKDAIEAGIAGKPVKYPKVEAIGCLVPELD